jgi:hypothetical protein
MCCGIGSRKPNNKLISSVNQELLLESVNKENPITVEMVVAETRHDSQVPRDFRYQGHCQNYQPWAHIVREPPFHHQALMWGEVLLPGNLQILLKWTNCDASAWSNLLGSMCEGSRVGSPCNPCLRGDGIFDNCYRVYVGGDENYQAESVGHHSGCNNCGSVPSCT